MSKEIFRFKIMHLSWELDNEGWIIEHEDGRQELRTTSHTNECETSLKELEDKIVETQNSLNGLLKAKALMNY
jgi:hypothetical protein